MGRRGIAALVFAVLALGAFLLVARHDGDPDQAALERKVAQVWPCPGDPAPPVRCRRVDDGWRCRVGGSSPGRVEAAADGHFEISKIC